LAACAVAGTVEHCGEQYERESLVHVSAFRKEWSAEFVDGIADVEALWRLDWRSWSWFGRTTRRGVSRGARGGRMWRACRLAHCCQLLRASGCGLGLGATLCSRSAKSLCMRKLGFTTLFRLGVA